jgi:membrane-bound inhibitor of C-type lysozyme
MPVKFSMVTDMLRIAVSKALVLTALMGLAGLSGCLTTSDAENRWGYTCTDGYEFTATYAGNDKSVVLKDADQEIKLKNLEAASGARYSDGSIDLWTKGALAFIKVDDEMVHPDCTGSAL